MIGLDFSTNCNHDFRLGNGRYAGCSIAQIWAGGDFRKLGRLSDLARRRGVDYDGSHFMDRHIMAGADDIDNGAEGHLRCWPDRQRNVDLCGLGTKIWSGPDGGTSPRAFAP